MASHLPPALQTLSICQAEAGAGGGGGAVVSARGSAGLFLSIPDTQVPLSGPRLGQHKTSDPNQVSSARLCLANGLQDPLLLHLPQNRGPSPGTPSSKILTQTSHG